MEVKVNVNTRELQIVYSPLVQRDVNITIEACEWYARTVEWKECE